MNILEGFSKNDDLVELICHKCNYSLWAPRFIIQELEEDNIFNGLNPAIPPEADCQICDGNMTPKSYTGIRGIYYEYKK